LATFKQHPRIAEAASWACFAAAASNQVLVAAIWAKTTTNGCPVLTSRAELAEQPTAQLESEGIAGALGTCRGSKVERVSSHELEGGCALSDADCGGGGGGGGAAGGGIISLAEGYCDCAFGGIRQELIASDAVFRRERLSVCKVVPIVASRAIGACRLRQRGAGQTMAGAESSTKVLITYRGVCMSGSVRMHSYMCILLVTFSRAAAAATQAGTHRCFAWIDHPCLQSRSTARSHFIVFEQILCTKQQRGRQCWEFGSLVDGAASELPAQVVVVGQAAAFVPLPLKREKPPAADGRSRVITADKCNGGPGVYL
jgi:hypothetical protein